MHPAIYVIGGLGAAFGIFEGVQWMQKRAKTADLKKTDTAKNAELSPVYAAGKAAGYTQGGLDCAKGTKDPSPETNASTIAASKLTAEPDLYLKGYAEGYVAGCAAAEVAAKISKDAKPADEPPPPAPAADAPPKGKPPSYTTKPNDEGYASGYASGRTNGRNNNLGAAPGSSEANGLKTTAVYGVKSKYDGPQIEEFAKAWDKGYQDGWDKGQFEYHESGGGSGGGFTKDTTDTTEEEVTGLAGFNDRRFAAILKDISTGAMKPGKADAVATGLHNAGYVDHARGIRALVAKVQHAPRMNMPPWIARRVSTRRAA